MPRPRYTSLAQTWVVEQADQLEKPLSTVTGDNSLDKAFQAAEIDTIDN